MSEHLPYNSILITGGAGFVGSNLAVSLKRKKASLTVLVLDNLRRRGSEQNMHRLKEHGIDFIHADIRNPEDLKFKQPVDLLMECSAEPSILAGYGERALYQINTNLVGTINCLELAREKGADIIFFSTSRVYPYDSLNAIQKVETKTRFVWDVHQEQDIRGWSPEGITCDFTVKGPKSIYGATKLCSEILLQEYSAMYGLKSVVNRCGVIAGPWQFGKIDQGIFSFWLLSHYFKRNLNYIGFGGKGKQVRDLIHIEDLCELIYLQLMNMHKANGKTYNVGGGTQNNLSLLEATDLSEWITGNGVDIGSETLNRPGDVRIYISDASAATEDFFWVPKKTAEDTFLDMFHWVQKNEQELRSIFA